MNIQSISIYSYAYDQQHAFYCIQLQLTCLEKTQETFTVMAGSSLLKIVKSNTPLYSCYHLAFNIEPSLLLSSASYLKGRNIALIENDRQVLIDFPDWNARSVYFSDVDGNVLEFIARYNLLHTLLNRSFSGQDIICISEAGIPAEDTESFISRLQQHTTAEIWKTYGPSFHAIGDENGLLIVVKEPRNWFPTQISARQLPMEIIIDQPGQDFQYEQVKISFTN